MIIFLTKKKNFKIFFYEIFFFNLKLIWILTVLEEFVASSVDPAPQRTADGIHFYYFGEHSTVEVTCLAPEGLPWPLVWWQGPEGAEMLTDGSGAGQSILSMTRIRRQDAGVYRCLAQNAFGTRSIPVNITVTSISIRFYIFYIFF